MHKQGPWTVAETKTVYQNPWITVTEDQVIRPDGNPGIFGFVSILSGASVLPLDDEKNVYLTKEYHYAVERETIEVISGGLDKNESALDGAKRELEEEAGIHAEEWIDMGCLDPFTSMVNSQDHMFLARKLTFTKSHQDSTEQIKILKVPFEQAYQWVKENKITHGASVALVLKTKIYLESK